MKKLLQNSRETLKRFFLGSFFAGFIVSLLIFAVFSFFIDLNYQAKFLKRAADMELILRSEKESHEAEMFDYLMQSRDEKFQIEVIVASQRNLIERASAYINFLLERIQELESIKPNPEEKEEEKKPSRSVE